MSNTSILVVGAGPAGLALALTIAKNGVPVRIINKAPQPHNEQRGAGIHPRTQEVFHFLGAMPDFQAIGRNLEEMRLYRLPNGTVPEATFHVVEPADPTPSRPFNNPMQIGQCQTEGILRTHLEKLGCSVELGTELRALEQFEDRVEATIVKHQDGREISEKTSFRWVVGADGGRSTVRKQAGFAFEGNATEMRSILGEVWLEGLDFVYWHQWIRPATDATPETTMHIRATEKPGLYWFFLTGDVDYDRVLADHDALRPILRDIMGRTDVTAKEIVYISDYRPSVRMANKFSEGRVFLAGDAAHVHTPRGGQGLNTSVQDAFNLGWKLTLVEKGLADPSLLASYSEERLPVVKRMIQETERMTRGVLRDHQDIDLVRSSWRRGDHLKQFGINYRWSSIVVDQRFKADVNAQDEEKEALDAYGTSGGDGLRAGDRAPDAIGLVTVGRGGDSAPTSLFSIFGLTHHTVLLFCSATAQVQPILTALKAYPLSSVSSVVIYPATASSVPAVGGDSGLVLKDQDGCAYEGYGVVAEEAVAVIVRPDGVVGGIVTGEEGVRKYFGRVLSTVKH